jgi:metal-responsive CopG/Arc/MetJ family transcriptional regulator
MRTTKSKEKRRHTLPPAAAPVKRVVVDFPAPLLIRAESAMAELATNRSELIRMAVEQYLEIRQRAKMEQDLAEGYMANAEQARQGCEEFAYIDSGIA